MDAIEPFDYSQTIPYDAAYFSGYLADKYDVDQKESVPRANERVTNSVKNTLRETVKGYDTVNEKNCSVSIDSGKTAYAMMPVWMLNTKYEGNMYTFAMNGQTGKIVGSLPVDMGKFYRYLAGITAIAMVIAQLGLFVVNSNEGSVPVFEAIAFVVSLIIGLISVFSMKSAMNTAVKQTEAGHYIKDGSFRLLVNRDVFMYTHTERYEKEQQGGGNNPPNRK